MTSYSSLIDTEEYKSGSVLAAFLCSFIPGQDTIDTTLDIFTTCYYCQLASSAEVMTFAWAVAYMVPDSTS